MVIGRFPIEIKEQTIKTIHFFIEFLRKFRKINFLYRMKSVWAILVPLFLMALSVGDARYYESDDYLQVFRPKKTESSR